MQLNFKVEIASYQRKILKIGMEALAVKAVVVAVVVVVAAAVGMDQEKCL